jgi:hypothetical protein
MYICRSGFQIIEYVFHARIPLISFNTRISVPKTSSHKQHVRLVKCDLTVYRPFPIVNSSMIRQFVDWDASGTLKRLLMLVKKFAKSQGVGSAVEGFLSSYAWVLLCLHVLMRDGLIPSLELHPDDRNGFQLDFSNLRCERGIAKTPVPFLLHRILTYYSSEFDVMNSVATLRGSGEVCTMNMRICSVCMCMCNAHRSRQVMSKSIWPRNLRWRLSVEVVTTSRLLIHCSLFSDLCTHRTHLSAPTRHIPVI